MEAKKAMTTEEVRDAASLIEAEAHNQTHYDYGAAFVALAEERDALAAKLDYATTWGNELAAVVGRMVDRAATFDAEAYEQRARADRAEAALAGEMRANRALDDAVQRNAVSAADAMARADRMEAALRRVLGDSICVTNQVRWVERPTACTNRPRAEWCAVCDERAKMEGGA